jgi:uncharacterized protein (TIGR02118 family)
MIKVISLLKRKTDLNFDEFKKWITEEHPRVGQKIPGLRGYRLNVLVSENPDAPYDAVSEMWFDDDAARKAAFDAPEGKAAAADAIAHCSSRFHLLSTEKIVIP